MSNVKDKNPEWLDKMLAIHDMIFEKSENGTQDKVIDDDNS